LSLMETLRHSVDRAYTAMVAAGIITRRLSMKNVANGWVLMQTVWLTAITTVTARIRDKWPIERTLELIDPALGSAGSRLTAGDAAWLTGVVAAAFIGQIAGRYAW